MYVESVTPNRFVLRRVNSDDDSGLFAFDVKGVRFWRLDEEDVPTIDMRDFVRFLGFKLADDEVPYLLAEPASVN